MGLSAASVQTITVKISTDLKERASEGVDPVQPS